MKIVLEVASINFEKKTIEAAITNREKISVVEYDLNQDKNSDFHFTYGCERIKIEINDFED